MSAAAVSVDGVRQNCHNVNRVLRYWFGQYRPELSQRQLWMIAASSEERRLEVDEEICHEFGPLLLAISQSGKEGAALGLLEEWCDNSSSGIEGGLYGWKGKVAAIILLDQMSRHVHRHLQRATGVASVDGSADINTTINTDHNELDESAGNRVMIPIVAVDEKESMTAKLQRLLPAQDKLDTLAYQSALQLHKAHSQEMECGMIPIPMLVFGLMPFRHANTLPALTEVQRHIEHASSLHQEIEHTIKRFRRATNRRIAVLQDEARRLGRKQKTRQLESAPLHPSLVKEETAALENTSVPEPGEASANLDSEGRERPEADDKSLEPTLVSPRSQQEEEKEGRIDFADDDILETFPFDADMSDASSHPVVKAVDGFLTGNVLSPASANRSQEMKLSSTDDKATYPFYPVIVSLSGGVDSMVLASVLSYLRDTNPDRYQGLRPVAAHIDYANRPESSAEASYVERYCMDVLRIPCRTRRIAEVTRGVTNRDEYEKVARTVRYDFYRHVVAEVSEMPSEKEAGDGQPSTSARKVGVMLGHHRGDLRENVLSNAHKGCGPLDLSGMTAVSLNDGVLIHRPLLPLEKTFVYDYAHRYGIPYFKDTTPHWSTRGKIRNKLLPLLEEIYGDGSMGNLAALAVESDQAKALLDDAVLRPFVDGIDEYPMGISFGTARWRNMGLYFWKVVLRDALHRSRRGMFSDKSVLAFLERVKPPRGNANVRPGWLQCRRDYAVFLRDDGKVFVFHPESFPWKKADQYDCIGCGLNVGDHTVVGPWAIAVRAVSPANEDEAKSLLDEKVFVGFEQLMMGSIRYFVQVPSMQVSDGKNNIEVEDTDGSQEKMQPLVFVSEYTKSSRPTAWKSVDMRIQRTLPLLGNNDGAIRHMENMEKPCFPRDWQVVEVTMTLICS